MKKLGVALLLVATGVASLPSHAAMDMTQGARIGVGGGRYEGEGHAQCSGPGCLTTEEITSTTVRGTYGTELGYNINVSDFYADVGLNLLRVRFENENNWRTDLLVTVGYFLPGDHWSVFAGFRRGWQGDGIFNDDTFSEYGPYAGVGFGGIYLGNWGVMNTAASYNFDKAKDFPVKGDDFSYPGVSVKLGLNFKGTPHSVQLRLQRFSGDDSKDVGGGTKVDFGLTETWAVLSYVFTFTW